MWDANGYALSMAEGDYGITLPIKIEGVTLSASDNVSFTIKTAVNGATLLEKVFANISNNTINLVLTAAETALLTPGDYKYALDWYHDGVFMCSLIPASRFRVVDKV